MGIWNSQLVGANGANIYGTPGESARVMATTQDQSGFFERSASDVRNFTDAEAEFADAWRHDYGNVSLSRVTPGVKGSLAIGLISAIVCAIITIANGAPFGWSVLAVFIAFFASTVADWFRRIIFQRYDLQYIENDEDGLPVEGIPYSPVDVRGLWFDNTPVGTVSDTWMQGYDGEVKVGDVLSQLPEGYFVFHDVKVPGSNANADHVVVGPSGVIFVDAKNWSTRRAITTNDYATPGGYDSPAPTCVFERDAIMSACGFNGIDSAVVISMTGATPVQDGGVMYAEKSQYTPTVQVIYNRYENLVDDIMTIDKLMHDQGCVAGEPVASVIHARCSSA